MCTPTRKNKPVGDDCKSHAEEKSMTAPKRSTKDGSGKKRAHQNLCVKLSRDDGSLSAKLLDKAQVSVKKRIVSMEGEDGDTIEKVLTIESGEFLTIAAAHFMGGSHTMGAAGRDKTNSPRLTAGHNGAMTAGQDGAAQDGGAPSNVYQAFVSGNVGPSDVMTMKYHKEEMAKQANILGQEKEEMITSYEAQISTLEEEYARLKKENEDMHSNGQIAKKGDHDADDKPLP